VTPLSEVEDFVAVSALQHVVYCDRQAALIHVDGVWEEDGATAAGRVLHDRADLPGHATQGSVKSVRSVALRCERLRILGRADVVEYHRDPTVDGGWRPFPVEYKRGRLRNRLADRVQVCAQGMCLEEMHRVAVPQGALYYGTSHRRSVVDFDAQLREMTEAAARRMHELISRREVPSPRPGPKCDPCSLASLCLPHALVDGTRGGKYLALLVEAAGG
jgi:CRISPR-associated exonuclease Cas4